MHDDENEFYVRWVDAMYEGDLATRGFFRLPGLKISPRMLLAMSEADKMGDPSPITEVLRTSGLHNEADIRAYEEWKERHRRIGDGGVRGQRLFPNHELRDRPILKVLAKRSLKKWRRCYSVAENFRRFTKKFGLKLEEIKAPMNGHDRKTAIRAGLLKPPRR